MTTAVSFDVEREAVVRFLAAGRWIRHAADGDVDPQLAMLCASRLLDSALRLLVATRS